MINFRVRITPEGIVSKVEREMEIKGKVVNVLWKRG